MRLLPVALLSHNVSAATAVAGDGARVRPGFTPAIGPWDIWTRFDAGEIIRTFRTPALGIRPKFALINPALKRQLFEAGSKKCPGVEFLAFPIRFHARRPFNPSFKRKSCLLREEVFMST